jgi:hypothetical protein
MKLTQFDIDCIQRYRADIEQYKDENKRLAKQIIDNDKEIKKRERWIKEILEISKEAS